LQHMIMDVLLMLTMHWTAKDLFLLNELGPYLQLT